MDSSVRERQPDGDTGAQDPLAPGAGQEVAVLLLPPVHSRGLAALLSQSGFTPVLPLDPTDWARSSREPPLLLVLDSAAGLELAASVVRARPDAQVLALVQRTTADDYRAALAACTAAVPLTAELPEIVAALTAVRQGLLVLPAAVARQLLTSRPAPAAAPALEPRERAWLRGLTENATVAGLGRASGYSEREMYRLLSGLYARLGATNRTQALLRAQELGLLDAPDPGDLAPARSRGR